MDNEKLNDLLNIKKKIILASKSPRRKKLLENLGMRFEVISSCYQEEKTDNYHNYGEYVKMLAYHKGIDVADKVNGNYIVISADTIVVLDDAILHKPTDGQDAYNILSKLSGKTHKVFTGLCLIDKERNKKELDYKCTEVSFRKLDDEEIWSYIKSGSPMDKAGAYGIQDDFGAVFVNHIKGCYYNIVGLPLELLYNMLSKLVK